MLRDTSTVDPLVDKCFNKINSRTRTVQDCTVLLQSFSDHRQKVNPLGVTVSQPLTGSRKG